ncbi:L-threonine 3-dehydrogenase-like [Penaeus japonicus]|uniref:L-threonine 3-dehydrogenase-like n=1 Tax=Penaeus japonicus TaxID=27405 RepID=UPI001C712DB0|nr:L-threonine 3-dehydrogenase-like [Penaeus japonicus]XP_042859716.1 L-threonine 3-dehydrogenase-like [Penaeus japonicus]XP_042859717.1 L-threonine 3-dehydrogenase-like [Penaeus japonicus]XP_042859719.1 L-threonine 3-dehydrogenase-like [Penaeus japonicus]XP_042859720.1 L-threonine 3-dehydrogenase-like [Penaeus japonicus]
MSVPSQMKCLLKQTGKEGYDLVTTPVPKAGPGDVIIKVDKVSICGSDINLWKWNDVAQVIAKLPFIPGHETTGVVVEVGVDVTEVSLGQRVAVENHFYCGSCYQCKEARGDICQRMDQYGHGRGTDQGGCSQFSRVPARYCYVLTRDLTPDQAVILEPMGVAHNAVDNIDVKGEDVLVLGCGPVGLFAIAVAKALGARAIYGVDVLPARLELATQMGATRVINGAKEDIKSTIMSLSDKNGVGRVVEASGSASLLNQSFSWLRKGGQMVLIGLPKSPLHVEDVLNDIIFKSLTLKTVHGRRIFRTWRECERLLADGLVDAAPLISHRLPMSQFEQAFQELLSGSACKILLDPQN